MAPLPPFVFCPVTLVVAPAVSGKILAWPGLLSFKKALAVSPQDRTALDTEPRTTVLVTHDVEEALLIGERVVVMSARPGRIRAQFEVHLPHAGSRRELIRHPEFAELRDEIFARGVTDSEQQPFDGRAQLANIERPTMILNLWCPSPLCNLLLHRA